MPAPEYEISDKEDRIRFGMESQRDLISMTADASSWKLMKDEGSIKVYRANQPFKDSGFRPFKSEVVIGRSCATVSRLADFRFSDRLKWDKLLEGAESLEQLNEQCFFTRHLTKKALKGVFSARESIDITTIDKQVQPDGSMMYIQSLVTPEQDYQNYPPTHGRVRVKHFCSGFLMFPIDGKPDQCRFVSVLCADLNMNSVGAMMTEWVKPTLMAQQCHDLLGYVASNPDEPNDL